MPADQKQATLRNDQLVHAAYHAGRGRTVEEVGEIVGCRHERVIRHSLFLFNIKFDDTPFGYRGIRARVAPKHLERLQKAATARGYLGDGGPERVLEDLVRAVMSHPTVLDSVLDDGVRTPE
jgi:hypothetical protein